MQCPICNKAVSTDARFCDQCGHDLQVVQQIDQEDMLAEIPGVDNADMVGAESLMEDLSPVLPAGQAEVESVEVLSFSENEQPSTASPTPDGSIPLAEEPEPASTDELPIIGPRLIMQGGTAIYTLSIGKEILVGREDPIDGIYPDIDLTPYDVETGVSRRHACFHEQGGQWFIKDLASTNYTIVNRRRLTAHEDYLLEDGDELRFGRVVAEFKV